ncbi:MAG: hypothetical protein MJ252_06025, partial [archaeon]|nr:hypothetical protein [archaeon]
EEKEKNVFEIKYHGMVIPIKNEKLKDLFLKIEEINSKIKKETELNKKVSLFQEHQNKIEEMIKIIKKEKTEENEQKGENFSKIYSTLLSYIENLRIKKYIDKNISFIEDYSKDFKNLELLSSLFEKDNLKLRVKPQEIIKLYDNLLEYQKQLINLEKDNPDQSYQVDLNYKEKNYSTIKTYFAGLFYILNKKYFDCYTLMFYFLEKSKECSEFFELHNLGAISHLKETHQILKDLEKFALFIVNQCFVKLEREKEKNSKMEIEDMSGKKENKKIKYQQYLIDSCNKKTEKIEKDNFGLLKDISKITFENYSDAVNKGTFNNYSQIVQIPISTVLIPPKPIVYDLTYEKFEYPNLEEKTKKQSKGLLGRTFGYFFGK